MRELEVTGLGDEGPGDVVGAFTGEAGIEADAIGEITIRDGRAVVEVRPDVADAVVETLDGGTVGRSEVRVRELDPDRVEPVRRHVHRFRNLVEMERDEEMRRHEREIRSLSGREREARGRALLHMRGRDEGEALGGYEVKFVKAKRDTPLPETEIAVGDLVMVSRRDPLRDDNPTGTFTERTNWSVTVAFDARPPDWVFGRGLRLDLYVNDVTYQRMQDALGRLEGASGRLAELRDVLVGHREPEAASPAEVDAWHDESLDASQRRAVRRAVATDDVHLIHGPPGTGKTTTAIEVVRQAIDRGERVLATAASNTAVDNLLEFLVDRGVDAVRVGHPARVTPTLREHTLDHLVRDREAYQASRQARERAFDLLDERDEHTYPSGRWRHGMGDEEILRLADQGRGSRGVPPGKIESMARWIELQREADELFAEADRLEDEAIEAVLEAADVVCTTNSTAGSDLLDGFAFDLLVLDEATQATEPSAWIPITHARRVVLAGDHRQLPPTVINEDAARQGLRRSLFERVADEHGDRVLDMLDTQYRMHETIVGFSSREFYDGALLADDAVRAHTLADLGVDLDLHGAEGRILDPAAPVAFVDTAGLDAPERTPPGSHSRENEREAELVADLARTLVRAGLAPADVCVITPYEAQRDRIAELVDEENLEVDTVDGFQGREKEAVLVSLVRSNDEGEIGFLEDLRRLNVALTRARRKLVVVGDADTIGEHPTYRRFVEYAKENGRRVRL